MQVLNGMGMHTFFKHNIAGSALCLSLVHCGISIAQDLFWSVITYRAQCYANTCCNEYLMTDHVKGLRKFFKNAIGNNFSVVFITDILKENRKLISSKTCNCITWSYV